MNDENICKFIPISANLGLSISCFIFESNQEIIQRKKELTHHNAFLIVKGEGLFCFDSACVPYTAGSIVFGFKNEFLNAKSSTETEYMYISFAGVRAEELFKRFGITKEHRVFDGFESLIPFWKESLSRADDTTIDLSAESILLYTFSRLYGHVNQINPLLNRVMAISEDHFNNPDLSINVIATELSYNSKYLSHFFKKVTGTTYSEYLRNLRIKYAISLLDHGIDSVKNISLLSGFKDPFYFSTVFKKCTGLSPKEYIASLHLNNKE